ncbi:acyl-CoA thioesterase domain-containing protein [Rhodococcus triatomae]
MGTPVAFFEQHGSGLAPTRFAVSAWSPDMLTGPAVCGALARAIETTSGDDDFVPARITVDMFRPVRNTLLQIETTPVRDGNRIRVTDAAIVQDGEVSAQARVVFLRRSTAPQGDYWTDPEVPRPPSVDESDRDRRRAHWGSGDDTDWTTHMSDHQGAERKRVWMRQFPIVAGEESSLFVNTTMVGELTSLLTNWGSDGVGYINADLTLALARLPESLEIGVVADRHVAADGVAVGTTTLFDRKGVFGTGLTTALGNGRRIVDYSRPPG